MSDKFTPMPLNAEQALAGYAHTFEGAELLEVDQGALISMATPLGKAAELEQQLQKAFGVGLPRVGKSNSADLNNTRILRLQEDLCFVSFDYSGDRAVDQFPASVAAAYLSDQSDSWVALKISGDISREALARICPLDLHPSVFTPGSVARTQMEHIGAIVICEQVDAFTLMAARSYGQSFLHAIEASITNVRSSV